MPGTTLLLVAQPRFLNIYEDLKTMWCVTPRLHIPGTVPGKPGPLRGGALAEVMMSWFTTQDERARARVRTRSAYRASEGGSADPRAMECSRYILVNR